MVGRNDYEAEKEAREKRLMAYTEVIQRRTQESSSQIIKELVEERHRQRLTQLKRQDLGWLQFLLI